jgi:hypothetical protein
MSFKQPEIMNNVYVDGVSPSLRISGSVASSSVDQQLTTTQDLSAGALNYTTTVGSNFILHGVYFVFDSATTQDVSLEYNGVEIFKETATTATSANIIANNLKILAGLGNELTIKCTNTGTPAINVDVIVDIEVI